MHPLIFHILPVDPQREADSVGKLEVIHILHVVVDWLLVPIEAALMIWLAALAAAALGWAAWGSVWLLRRTFASRPA